MVESRRDRGREAVIAGGDSPAGQTCCVVNLLLFHPAATSRPYRPVPRQPFTCVLLPSGAEPARFRLAPFRFGVPHSAFLHPVISRSLSSHCSGLLSFPSLPIPQAQHLPGMQLQQMGRLQLLLHRSDGRAPYLKHYSITILNTPLLFLIHSNVLAVTLIISTNYT